jgi:putative copper resistance protein D
MQWLKEDKKESGRIDRAADRAAAMGEDDELAQYNRYLRNLNQSDTNQ